MPKKFRGENSKAVEARARKAAQKEAENERQQRQLEDEFWKEDDKNVLKKLQRKVGDDLALYLTASQSSYRMTRLSCLAFSRLQSDSWLHC